MILTAADRFCRGWMSVPHETCDLRDTSRPTDNSRHGRFSELPKTRIARYYKSFYVLFNELCVIVLHVY